MIIKCRFKYIPILRIQKNDYSEIIHLKSLLYRYICTLFNDTC